MTTLKSVPVPVVEVKGVNMYYSILHILQQNRDPRDRKHNKGKERLDLQSFGTSPVAFLNQDRNLVHMRTPPC